MKDIKLLETCPYCGEHLTLMGSVNVEDNKSYLVKKCLSCGNFPLEQVAEIVE